MSRGSSMTTIGEVVVEKFGAVCLRGERTREERLAADRRAVQAVDAMWEKARREGCPVRPDRKVER